MSAEYRIDFSITRRRDDEDDFTEIGFGSSGAWDSIEQASHMVASAIDTGEYTVVAAGAAASEGQR